MSDGDRQQTVAELYREEDELSFKLQADNYLEHQLIDYKNNNDEINFDIDKDIADEVLNNIIIFATDDKDKRKEALTKIENAIYKNDKDDSYKKCAPIRVFDTSNDEIFFRIRDADLNNFQISAEKDGELYYLIECNFTLCKFKLKLKNELGDIVWQKDENQFQNDFNKVYICYRRFGSKYTDIKKIITGDETLVKANITSNGHQTISVSCSCHDEK